ncbi:MAG TPA: DPP IV N-terminal domain-containing protein, partial [Longimicrobiales bacterium]
MSCRGLAARFAAALVAFFLVPGAVGAQAGGGGVADYVPAAARGQAFDLSIRSIMRAEGNVGSSPSQVRWTDDSRWIYFRWQPGGQEWDAGSEQYRIPAQGGAPELVSDEHVEEMAVMLAGGDVTADGRWRVSSVDGDLYVVDRQSWNVRRLTETRDPETGPRFSADGSRIFYRSGSNLFAMNVADGMVRQLTDVRSGSPDPDEPEAEGHHAFLEAQQAELFEFIRRQKEREAEQEAEREAREAGEPQPLFIPQGENAGGLSPSADGSYVLVSTFRQGPSTQNTSIPFWITESGYTEPRNGRSKVGDGGPGGGRVGLLTTATNAAAWIDPKPEGYEGDVQAGTGDWNDAGTHALVFA